MQLQGEYRDVLLVFDRHTNELIGFVELGDKDVSVAVLESPTTLKSHILAFMVRGMASDLTFILRYFSTQSLTSSQIMPLFWKAAFLGVCSCKRLRFFHRNSTKSTPLLLGKTTLWVLYIEPSTFAPSRYIYFFSDAPHFLKTSRNCLFNSGTGKHCHSTEMIVHTSY